MAIGRAYPMGMRPGSRWKFFKTFLKSPAQMGGVVPSSRALAAAVADTVRRLEMDQAVRVIEVGPGTGALTRELVRLPHPLVLLERNPEFAGALAVGFPGAKVLCEDFLSSSVFSSGQDERHGGAIVVSSLPIRSLPRPELFRARFRSLLLEGSVRAVVQYSYGLRDPLELNDSRFEVTRSRFVPWNVPPAFIWNYRLK